MNADDVYPTATDTNEAQVVIVPHDFVLNQLTILTKRVEALENRTGVLEGCTLATAEACAKVQLLLIQHTQTFIDNLLKRRKDPA